MPADRAESDRQKLRARARHKMGLWAIASGCMVMMALYGSAMAHRKVHTPSEYHKMFDGFSGDFVGSCWCGADRYCMCTPSLAIDTVIEMVNEEHGEVEAVLAIRRKDNNKLACVGGFVKVGETLEEAVRREVMEETSLTVTSMQMIPRVYDNPSRDSRRHTVSVAYIIRVQGEPRAGKEEKEVVRIPTEKIMEHLRDFAFDHSKILSDYLQTESTVSKQRDLVVDRALVTSRLRSRF